MVCLSSQRVYRSLHTVLLQGFAVFWTVGIMEVGAHFWTQWSHGQLSLPRGLFFSCYQVVGRMGLLYGPLRWEDVLTVNIFMASSWKAFSRVLSSHSASKRSDHANNNSALVLFPGKWKSLSRVRFFATPWTVPGILQVRILEWVAIPFFKESSQSRDRTQVSHIAGRFFTKLSHQRSCFLVRGWLPWGPPNWLANREVRERESGDDDGNNDSHNPHFRTILTRYRSAYLVIQCSN